MFGTWPLLDLGQKKYWLDVWELDEEVGGVMALDLNWLHLKDRQASCPLSLGVS